MNKQRLQEIEVVIARNEMCSGVDGDEFGDTSDEARELLAEVRLLQVLLKDAHGYIVSESFCSCDDSPSVPCPVAQALEGA